MNFQDLSPLQPIFSQERHRQSDHTALQNKNSEKPIKTIHHLRLTEPLSLTIKVFSILKLYHFIRQVAITFAGFTNQNTFLAVSKYSRDLCVVSRKVQNVSKLLVDRCIVKFVEGCKRVSEKWFHTKRLMKSTPNIVESGLEQDNGSSILIALRGIVLFYWALFCGNCKAMLSWKGFASVIVVGFETFLWLELLEFVLRLYL